MFDQELEFKSAQWNAQNAQVVEQANVQWRRQANTMDTAAQNESNKASAQMAFNINMGEQNLLWQQLRDRASFDQQTAENKKERAMAVLTSIYSNTALMVAGEHKNFDAYLTNVTGPLDDIIGF